MTAKNAGQFYLLKLCSSDCGNFTYEDLHKKKATDQDAIWGAELGGPREPSTKLDRGADALEGALVEEYIAHCKV